MHQDTCIFKIDSYSSHKYLDHLLLVFLKGQHIFLAEYQYTIPGEPFLPRERTNTLLIIPIKRSHHTPFILHETRIHLLLEAIFPPHLTLAAWKENLDNPPPHKPPLVLDVKTLRKRKTRTPRLHLLRKA